MKDDALPKEFLGMSVVIMDNLPPDAFLLISRLPHARFQAVYSHAGTIKSWTGTLTEANDQTGTNYMPDTSSRARSSMGE